MEDRVFLSGSAGRGSSRPGLAGYGSRARRNLHWNRRFFCSSHRPQRIESPGFRVSPHEPPDPLFSTSFSHLISLSLDSLSLTVGCSGRRAKKTNEEERRKPKERRKKGKEEKKRGRGCAWGWGRKGWPDWTFVHSFLFFSKPPYSLNYNIAPTHLVLYFLNCYLTPYI